MIRSLSFLLPLVVAVSAAAFAQSTPTRVVVMPFDASAAASTYQLGLPTALQRSINEIPNVYVPAVGDVALVMQKAQQAGKDPLATVRSLFGADAVVQGKVNGSGATVSVTMTLDQGGSSRR